MPLSPRENLLRTLRRQGFENVPVDPSWFCPSQMEAFKKRFGHDDIAGYFETPFRVTGVPMAATHSDPRNLFLRETLPENVSFSVYGVAYSHHPGCLHLTRMHHPLNGEIAVEDVERFPFPVVSADQDALTVQTRAIQSQGFAAMGQMSQTVWETSWYIRSMEDLMVDMMSDSPLATLILDRVTALSCQTARMFARAGTDILRVGDDIGMQSAPMMDPGLWRKWIKPRLAAVLRAAREIKPDILVYYHSCGFVMPFIEDLIAMGVDILQPVQPECMDFADVVALAGGRLSFWSTIGTQRLLPFGTPEDVRACVKRNLDLCGEQGGIVIGPTHMVEPEVPWENLEAMRLATKEYRRL